MNGPTTMVPIINVNYYHDAYTVMHNEPGSTGLKSYARLE